MVIDPTKNDDGDRSWQAHAERERQHVRDLGLLDVDLPMTDEYRQIIRERISIGLASARQGKLVDGEAFMAQMYAELN